MSVAVLYAKRGSVYNDLAVDVWDEARDARRFPGGKSVVAHPPCRGWGRYAWKAKASDAERELAFHALQCVREYGGVLEHPYASRFWIAARLPRPGEFPDEYGGYSIFVRQCDWGHRAEKPTWLYIVGVPAQALPEMPGSGEPVTDVERMWRGEREATPARFATWLVQVASRAHTYLGPKCI